MGFSNVDIGESLKRGEIKIRPLKTQQIGPASVDLTLGDEWYFVKKEFMNKRIDLAKVGFDRVMKKIRAKTITLEPGGMCLGKTVERITLPNDIIGRLEGRSRYARMGLSVHITSAVVQPGSDNHQVLEIVNFAPFTVILHAGMRVSQVIFHRLNSASTKPYAKFGEIALKQ